MLRTYILIYVNNEPKLLLARDLGNCCDNLKNSESVFFIVKIVKQKFAFVKNAQTMLNK